MLQSNHFVLLALLLASGCSASRERQAKIERTEAQVRRLVEELDQQTTATGKYIRAEPGKVKSTDAWNRPLQVVYSQGGLAETVTVRSAGPDAEFHTDDDIEATGLTAHLAGIGEGVKRNAEETAANVAKGVVQGTAQGMKELVSGALTRKRPAAKGEAAGTDESIEATTKE